MFLGTACSVLHIAGFGGEVAPPTQPYLQRW